MTRRDIEVLAAEVAQARGADSLQYDQRVETAALAALEKAVAASRDKALRFDLDQLGIERREQEACELVDLRARVVELEQACAKLIDFVQKVEPQPEFKSQAKNLAEMIRARVAKEEE